MLCRVLVYDTVSFHCSPFWTLRFGCQLEYLYIVLFLAECDLICISFTTGMFMSLPYCVIKVISSSFSPLTLRSYFPTILSKKRKDVNFLTQFFFQILHLTLLIFHLQKRFVLSIVQIFTSDKSLSGCWRQIFTLRNITTDVWRWSQLLTLKNIKIDVWRWPLYPVRKNVTSCTNPLRYYANNYLSTASK